MARYRVLIKVMPYQGKTGFMKSTNKKSDSLLMTRHLMLEGEGGNQGKTSKDTNAKH